jgi:acyl carrier protein
MNAEKIIEAINRTLNLSLDPATTPQDDGFKSLGIDSLDFFNVLVELESVTGRNVPDEDVEKLTTIRSLVDYFS